MTAVTANRRRLFQVQTNANLLLRVLAEDRAARRYQMHAWVIMPDHIHLLLTPAPDISIEKAMQFVKGGFSFRLKSKSMVWQPSFTLRRIEDAGDFDVHGNYIHTNPVRAGLCEKPENFTFSSAHPQGVIDPAPRHLRGVVIRA